MQSLLHESLAAGETVGLFLLVTVAIGGWAAWMAARGLARTWRPFWQCALALLFIAAAVRFIHFALFGGPLLSAQSYLIDAVTVLLIGATGYRFTRAGQMTTQYRWLYERTGPLTWRERPGTSDRP